MSKWLGEERVPVTKDKMRGFVGDGFVLRHTHAPDQGGEALWIARENIPAGAWAHGRDMS